MTPLNLQTELMTCSKEDLKNHYFDVGKSQVLTKQSAVDAVTNRQSGEKHASKTGLNISVNLLTIFGTITFTITIVKSSNAAPTKPLKIKQKKIH